MAAGDSEKCLNYSYTINERAPSVECGKAFECGKVFGRHEIVSSGLVKIFCANN